MACPLQPLQLLIQRRTSIFKSVPKLFSSSNNTLTPPSLNRSSSPPIYHLDTKYGLRLSFENGRITALGIVPPSSQTATSSPRVTKSPITDIWNANAPTNKSSTYPTDDQVPSPPQPPKSRYSYRLFPDWQTSYLWYDVSSQHAALDGQVHVDEDDISDRYPALEPYYFAWQEIYESAFEKQGCHLGAQAEVFLDLHERLVWKVEGFLIASWLVLMEDVEKVEYQPTEKAYLLKKDGVRAVFESFLEDVNLELRR